MSLSYKKFFNIITISPFAPYSLSIPSGNTLETGIIADSESVIMRSLIATDSMQYKTYKIYTQLTLLIQLISYSILIYRS